MAKRLNHRWINPPERPSHTLSIRTCASCKLQKHSHHESEGGRDVHFTTFHRPDGTRVRGTAGPAPECTGYVASGHPSRRAQERAPQDDGSCVGGREKERAA